MPALILNDVPQSLFDKLQSRATAGHSSVPDMTLLLLKQILEMESTPRYPDPLPDDWGPNEMISAPFDLPFTTPGKLVPFVPGKAPPPEISDLPQEYQ